MATDNEQKEKRQIQREGKHSETDRSNNISSGTTNAIDTSGGLTEIIHYRKKRGGLDLTYLSFYIKLQGI